MLRDIFTLLRLALLIEYRRKWNLMRALLFMACAVFIAYLGVLGMGIPALPPSLWNVLFWILFLFLTLSFTQRQADDSRGRLLELYVSASASAILFSRLLHHALMLVFLATCLTLLYMFFLGNPVHHLGLFVLTVFLSVLGYSAVLTPLGLMLARLEAQALLLPVLGIPLLVPVFLSSLELSTQALAGAGWVDSFSSIVRLCSFVVLVLATSSLLFPYLWKA